jgi:hypothetical protein
MRSKLKASNKVRVGAFNVSFKTVLSSIDRGRSEAPNCFIKKKTLVMLIQVRENPLNALAF